MERKRNRGDREERHAQKHTETQRSTARNVRRVDGVAVVSLSSLRRCVSNYRTNNAPSNIYRLDDNTRRERAQVTFSGARLLWRYHWVVELACTDGGQVCFQKQAWKRGPVRVVLPERVDEVPTA